ncbi:MAG: hemerythrin domain-containing protein [Geodermatophilaceae bacterium]|nr:hemerythrin domain-containing protein [Geodermatophilaceae bacterium]
MTTGISDNTVMMFAIHDALRRDAAHLARAVERQDMDDPARREAFLIGWEVFKRQLRHHHEGEDVNLWPLIRTYLPARDEENALLNAMEEEHERIDPLITDVDTALRNSDSGWLAEATVTFRQELFAHLEHEERDAVPLMEAVLTPQDWKAFSRTQRKDAGVKGAREFFPYILDEADPERAAQVTRLLPPPLRILVRRAWQPRYAKMNRWN